MTDAAMVGKPRYKRIENDAYQTPAWCVDVLCDHMDLGQHSIWEPATGNGNITEALRRRGYRVHGTDIDGRNDGLNFLEYWINCNGPIVTNPPYKLAEAFVRHALAIEASQVCMLLRHEWDCAKTRNDLFTSGTFAKKITLTKRPKWIDGPLKASPRHNFSWYIWDRAHTGPPTIEYGP